MLRRRRQFLQAAALGAAGASLNWRRVLAAPHASSSLEPADAFGVMLPDGYQARLLGTTGRLVGSTGFRWHEAPDGGGVFATDDGGWIYVSNSEANGNSGGVGAIRFAADGAVVSAYRIAENLKWVCGGGVTPWGTWLACEEYRGGYVWECDPTGEEAAVVRPALGRFVHEAAAVDPGSGFVYLTEDEDDGRLYCFRPTGPDLGEGNLFAASVDAQSHVTWVQVSSDKPYRGSDTTAFLRLEGATFDSVSKTLFFTTTTDHKVWALNVLTSQLSVIYDGNTSGGPLFEPDNIAVHSAGNDLFVAEDNDNLELVRFHKESNGVWDTSVFVRLIGHDSSELAGPALSPNGTRLYFSSQRGRDGRNGMTFELSRIDGGVI